jgi:hypothetical protein
MMSDGQIKMNSFMLGTIVCRFILPQDLIDDINLKYDTSKNLKPANHFLVGKIKNEFKVNSILSDDVNSVFKRCFKEYLKKINKQLWDIDLENAWINDMKSNEFNPFHWHSSPTTDLGLSSVLMLKKPNTYGEEYAREEVPANGLLEFVGGQQDPLSIPHNRVDAQVGELYVFPYTLMHGVYPFNGTDEVRRTMSYNCNLYRPDNNPNTIQQKKDM